MNEQIGKNPENDSFNLEIYLVIIKRPVFNLSLIRPRLFIKIFKVGHKKCAATTPRVQIRF